MVVPCSRFSRCRVAKKSDAATGSSCKHGCQAYQLLLPSGQRIRPPPIQGLQSKVTDGFCDSCCHLGLGHTQGFQPEGKLLPDSIRDDLPLRILPDKSHCPRLRLACRENCRGKPDLPFPAAMGGAFCFQQPQQGAFSGTGTAAKQQDLTPWNSQCHILQRRGCCSGISKAECCGFHKCHLIHAPPSSNPGKSSSKPNPAAAASSRAPT